MSPTRTTSARSFSRMRLIGEFTDGRRRSPEFPDKHARACREDDTPPLLLATNLYGQLRCTICVCGQIFVRQVETNRSAQVWALDESVRDRIQRMDLEALE